jgi:hypothetical protein
MFRKRITPAVLAGALIALAAPPASAVTEVDVKLVIATDTSNSINDTEAKLQREGTADVFLEPEVVKAIQSGPLGRIAVAMVDWSNRQSVVLDWTIISDKASAAALSEKIRAIPRTPGERTSISGALDRSFRLLNESDNAIVAEKKVVDVSGDGPNNDGVSLQHFHDTTKDNGVVVNGLPIMDATSEGYYEDLDKYYAACVVAGKGAFLVVTKSYKDFATAMRRKLVLEISQNETQIKEALGLPGVPLLKNIAAGVRALPQVNLPAKTYPGGCDKFGGFGYKDGN